MDFGRYPARLQFGSVALKRPGKGTPSRPIMQAHGIMMLQKRLVHPPRCATKLPANKKSKIQPRNPHAPVESAPLIPEKNR